MAKKYPQTLTCMRMALTLLFLTLIPLLGFASDTQHMVPLSLQERVKQADFVVEGEVVKQESFWDAQHENIYTSSIVKVYKSFKGDVKAEQVEVITEGGTVGLKKHVFSTALQLKPGQQGLFFLNRQRMLQRTPGRAGLSTSAYGSQQGFVRYDVESRTARSVFDSYNSVQELYNKVTEQTGKDFRTINENQRLKAVPVEQKQQQGQQEAQAPIITSFSPLVASAGTGTILTINGTGFGSSRGNGSVEFRNADDGGQTYVKPLPTEYISWTNTQIRMYIPSVMMDEGTAGSGPIRVTANDGSSFVSAASITLQFAYSNVDFDNKSFKPILTGQDGTGGYTIFFAPSMESKLAAKEGFRRAMNTWVCVSQVNWKLGGPTTKEATSEDGLVVIRFAPQSTVGAGVLARTISRYEGCANSSDTLFWVSEFDMEINSNINWQYGPAGPENRQYDYETVVLHELGHAHQLGHVNIPRAVMFYAIEFERLERDLSSLDIEGARLVMANSVGPNFCDEPPIVPNPNGECNLAPEILTLEAEFTSAGAVLVSWTTRNEQQVEEFIVQRSQDGIEFEDIGTVAAKGPNSGDLTYTFTDPSPLRKQSYYRLEVVYSNNTSSFSPRVPVLNPADLRNLVAYPNPIGNASAQGGANGQLLQLEYLVSSSSIMQVQLFSAKGQVVREYQLTFSTGTSQISIDVSNLAAGMYFLKWQEGNRGGVEKVLKL